MKSILRWLRDPYIRYWIKSDSWRSIWIYWGWTSIGLKIRHYKGTHLWISIGPASIIHSINRGKPNNALL